MLSRKKMWAALHAEARFNETLTKEAIFQLMRFYTKGTMDIIESKDRRALVDHKGGMLIEIDGIYKIQPAKDRSILISGLPVEWRSYFTEKFMEGAKQLPDYASEWLKSVCRDSLSLDGDIRNLFKAIFNSPATCCVKQEGEVYQIMPTTMALLGKTKREFYIRFVKSDVHSWAVVTVLTANSKCQLIVKLEKYPEQYKALLTTLNALVYCTDGGLKMKPENPSAEWMRVYNAFSLMPTDAMRRSEAVESQMKRLTQAFSPEPRVPKLDDKLIDDLKTSGRVRREVEFSDPNDPERPWLKRAQAEARHMPETKAILEDMVNRPCFTVEEREMSPWGKFKAFCILNPGVVALGLLAVGTVGIAAIGSSICTG